MFSLLVHLRPQDTWKSVCFYLLISVGARCELAVVIGDHLSISFQRHWENIMRITIIQI
jgi:hypothetical protein